MTTFLVHYDIETVVGVIVDVTGSPENILLDRWIEAHAAGDQSSNFYLIKCDSVIFVDK